jgi:hypothetical protein
MAFERFFGAIPQSKLIKVYRELSSLWLSARDCGRIACPTPHQLKFNAERLVSSGGREPSWHLLITSLLSFYLGQRDHKVRISKFPKLPAYYLICNRGPFAQLSAPAALYKFLYHSTSPSLDENCRSSFYAVPWLERLFPTASEIP